MSSHTYGVLIMGYVLPDDTEEDFAEGLAEQFKCACVCFNEGYDEPYIFALVPEILEIEDEEMVSEDVIIKALIGVKEIQRLADQAGYTLPKATYGAKTLTY